MDWNRDGANDVCVSHVDEPVALLLNTSILKGNSISLHLRGVNSCRDAIGAIVKVTRGKEHRYGFLTSGDGFQASNEKEDDPGFGDLGLYRPSHDLLAKRIPPGFDVCSNQRHDFDCRRKTAVVT